MLGTTVNALAIVVGSLIGLLLKKNVPEKMVKAIMYGNALCIIYIGVSGMLKGQKTLAAIIAVAIGAVVGTLLDLDGKMNALGRKVESVLAKNSDGTFAQGFVTASLLFCVGAMAIVGSLQSGLTGDHNTLYTKSLLDFITSIVLSASLGIGVALSAVSVFIYQGAITLLAGLVQSVLTDAVIAEVTCVGSILIMGLGLNMLEIVKLKVVDYIPAVFIVIGLCYII